MRSITELFSQYKQNITFINSLPEKFRTNKPIQEWSDYYLENMGIYRKIYQQNNQIIQEMQQLLESSLDDATVDEIYFACKKMYDEYTEDGLLFVLFFEKLIPYYEKRNDLNKLLICHSYACYELNDVFRMNYGYLKRDFKHSYQILKYTDQYDNITDADSRFRIWIAYYNLIVYGNDSDTISISECLRYYHDFEKLWSQPQVQALDGNDPRFVDMHELICQRLLSIESRITDASPEEQEEFFQVSDHFYQKTIAQNPDPMQMDMVVFVAHLKTEVLRKEKTLESNFSILYSYFQNMMKKMNEGETPSAEDIFFIVRTSTTLTNWMKAGLPNKLIDPVMGDLLTICESKWKKLQYVFTSDIDDLMLDFLKIILSMPYEKMEKERYIFEFGIKREIPIYLESIRVKNISLAILESLLEKNQDTILSSTNMTKNQLIDFIEKAATFHNVGMLNLKTMRTLPYRDLFPAEQEQIDSHCEGGVELLQNAKELSEYESIILNHHNPYESRKTAEQNDNLITAESLALEIIHAAVFLEESACLFPDNSYAFYREQLNKMQEERGTNFHPMIVDTIWNNTILQETIQSILFDDSISCMYSVYHSFDLNDTQDELRGNLDQLFTKIQNAKTNEDYIQCETELQNLFTLAQQSNSKVLMGLFYFTSMFYYDRKQEYFNASNEAMRALQFLEGTGELKKIARIYNFLGIYASQNGEYGNSLSNYLLCAEYCKKCGDYVGIGIPYYNISLIFNELANYVKALEYLEKSEIYLATNQAEELLFMSFKGYYYACLGQYEIAATIREQLEQSISDLTDYPKFMVHCFFAYEDLQEKNIDGAFENLKIAQTDSAIFNHYLGNADTFTIFFRIFFETGKYTEMLACLDTQILVCEKYSAPYHIHLNLIRFAIKCAKNLNDQSLIWKYGQMLDDIFLKQDIHKSEQVLQAEFSAIDSIATKTKHEMLMKDNQRLQEGIRDAEKTNIAKNTFLSSVSHELRTPIHAVLGLNEMILQESKDKNILQYAADIQNAGKTLLGIINDILDYSKLESGKMELVQEEYETKTLIREVIDMFESRATKKNLAFIVKANSTLPMKLRGDSLRIKQILSNIMSNAVKYTEKGSIIFSIDYEKTDSDKINLRFSVADTGIGMKPEGIKKVVQPFVRLDSKENLTLSGSGLGMSIVTNLLKQMHSKLNVESTYGVGSNFSFVLLQEVIEWKAVGDIKANSGLKNELSSTVSYTAPNAKILVVDDTAVNLTVVKGLLKKTKMQLTMVKSGTECLKVCETQKFHLILMDHRMPPPDGVETLHILRETPGPNQDTPVIALTANAITGAYEYYSQEGFDDLLIKPVNGNLLKEHILTFLPADIINEL